MEGLENSIHPHISSTPIKKLSWKLTAINMAPAWFVSYISQPVFSGLTQLGISQGRARFKKALADFHSPVHGRTLNPEKEIAITTGATAGILAALMAFVEEGDEVIVIEPFFNL